MLPIEGNGKEIREEAGLLEEKRMVAAFTSTIVKKSATPGYSFRVRPREFNIEDLGLRRADIENKNVKDGKLAANWKSPYRVWAGTPLVPSPTFGKNKEKC